MRRTSFVGALSVIALGGVLAFGIQSSPKDLDLHLTGLIILLAGVADLVLRFLIADSPLFSQSTADVAAVVEPVGEPVLDAFGNPIVAAESVARPPLIAPLPVTPVAPHPTRVLPVVVDEPEVVVQRQRAAVQQHAAVQQQVGPDQVVRQVGDHGMVDEALVPVSPLTGRPVRTRWRRRRVR